MLKFKKSFQIVLGLCIVLVLAVGCGNKEKGLKVVNLIKTGESSGNIVIKELYISNEQNVSNDNLLESSLEYDDDITVKLSTLFEVKDNQKINITIVDDDGKSYIWYNLEVNDGYSIEMRMTEGMITAYVINVTNDAVPHNPNTIVLP